MKLTDTENIRKAAAIITDGGLAAMPTETVYGLAADAGDDRAVARIFEAKGRPQFNPLIIHVAGAEMAERYVALSPMAIRLAAAFWPGPFTMVLPRRADAQISLLVSAGLDTLAVRAPRHEFARALITAVDRPLAAPSANKSGSISPTTANHVRSSLGDKIDYILDGGACSVGVESTIVKVDGDDVLLLRPGGVTRREIETITGSDLRNAPATSRPQAPGGLDSHYAPRAPLRINSTTQKENEAFLGFGDIGVGFSNTLNLSADGDLTEAAANLFSYLRQLDDMCAKKNLTSIAAAPVPTDGLGEAINDRLARAATPK